MFGRMISKKMAADKTEISDLHFTFTAITVDNLFQPAFSHVYSLRIHYECEGRIEKS